MEQSVGVAKLTRLKEAWHVLRHHSANSASWGPLIGAYSSTLRSATDQSLINVELEIAGRGFPVRMRNSDIYTVAEILHERQYALKSPLPKQPVIIDAGSNIGDPLFEGSEIGDFVLKKHSAAWKIGFNEIPINKIGLYPSEERPVLPTIKNRDNRAVKRMRYTIDISKLK